MQRVAVCLCVLWAAEEEGRGWPENLCHIFPSLSAEKSVSVLNLDSVQNERRIGIICSFVQIGMCVRPGISSSGAREYRCAPSFPAVAYRALVPRSRKENLKALHF